MSLYNTIGNHRRRSHRHKSRRMFMKRVSLVVFIVGLLVLIMGIMISVYALFYDRHRTLLLSLFYIGGGAILLLLHWLFDRLRHRQNHDQSDSLRVALSSAVVAPMPPPKAPEPSPTPTDREGAVLIMVLALLALISGLIVNVQLSARSELRHAQAVLLKSRLNTAAADAARSALRRVANDEDFYADGTNEVWAQTEEGKDPSGIATRVTVVDENRFFDLNNLGLPPPGPLERPAAEIFMDLMTLCGNFTPVEPSDALTDWIDSDDSGFVETPYYQTLTPPYNAANRRLYTLSEVLLVKGFNRALFNRHDRRTLNEVYSADLIDCFTAIPVLRTSPIPVNVNTASRDVLLGVLGMDQEATVQSILFLRNSAPIRSIESIFAVSDPALAKKVRRWLDVKSNVFTVLAQAYADGMTEQIRVTALRSAEGQVEILQWVF